MNEGFDLLPTVIEHKAEVVLSMSSSTLSGCAMLT